MIEVSEGIPFIEMTDWDHDRLYALKGDIVRRGIEQVTGHRMPVYEKRRMQHGATQQTTFRELFPEGERAYRRAFADLYAP